MSTWHVVVACAASFSAGVVVGAFPRILNGLVNLVLVSEREYWHKRASLPPEI